MRSSDPAAAAGVTVAAFYRFVTVDDAAALRSTLLEWCHARAIRGTILVAPEGINATVAGAAVAVAGFLEELRRDARFADIEPRLTWAAAAPFRRLKVKLKREIVSFGVPRIAPREQSGIRVEPAAWNDLLTAPDVLLIDARNDYEIRLGSFPGARAPGTRHFREFPAFVERNLDPTNTPRVAMFCTGGIRCEKASAYLLERGFKEVYQLEGGILRYLEEIPVAESRWQGECFIFDTRVALDDAGHTGRHVQCHACRQPLGSEALASPLYEDGVSCPYCHGQTSATRRAAFRERRRQVALAAQRDTVHIGAVMDSGAADTGEDNHAVAAGDRALSR